jgi:hypothetical protein
VNIFSLWPTGSSFFFTVKPGGGGGGGAGVAEVVGAMGAINGSSKKIVDIIGIFDGIAFQPASWR